MDVEYQAIGMECDDGGGDGRIALMSCFGVDSEQHAVLQWERCFPDFHLSEVVE